MRTVIAHYSIVALSQLQQRLKGRDINIVRKATTLTEVYDYTEHHAPDCVIMPMDMADCPEFELLAALLRILGVTCVVLNATDSKAISTAFSRAHAGIHVLAETVTNEVLVAALRTRCHRAIHEIAVKPISQELQLDRRNVILIGSSTGGIDALMQVFHHFNCHSPPVVIVQHTGARFTESLIRLLNTATTATVLAAQHNTELQQGHIYVASGDTHHVRLTHNAAPRIKLDDGPPVSGHRPSVDALFQSAAEIAPHVTAAILTGMGRDGATGITTLRKAGARTIGQDEATSVVYGMPRVAKSLGGIETELPIHQIGPALLRTAAHRQRA